MKKQFILFVAPLLCVASMYGQSRVVLIEQFSNSGCPPCASFTPPILNYVNNNPGDVVAVSYHTGFPYNDSMYHENPAESNARVAYYGIVSVPYSVVDGNYYENASNVFVPQIATTINNRKQNAPDYEIEEITLGLNGNVLSGSFKLTSLSAANVAEDLVAHVVIIEKNVLKSSYIASPGANTETQYGYVMRKMLPNAGGTDLVNKGLNEVDTISFNWNLDNIKDINQLRVVVFVQNNFDKEIYQAKMYQIQTVGIKTMDLGSEMKMYPNPANSAISVELNQEQFIESVSIHDALGKLVYYTPVMAEKSKLDLNFELNPGVYSIRLKATAALIRQKLIIAN